MAGVMFLYKLNLLAVLVCLYQSGSVAEQLESKDSQLNEILQSGDHSPGGGLRSALQRMSTSLKISPHPILTTEFSTSSDNKDQTRPRPLPAVDPSNGNPFGEIGSGVSAAAEAAAGSLGHTMLLTEMYMAMKDKHAAGTSQEATQPALQPAPQAGGSPAPAYTRGPLESVPQPGWQELEKTNYGNRQPIFYSSPYDRPGRTGNPLNWTMVTVYVALLALICLGVVVFIPCGARKRESVDGYPGGWQQ